jgi:hypothetical protein
MKDSLFIGSCSEDLNVAYAIQRNLDPNFEVTVWTQGIFQLSQFTMESILDALDTSDFGVFVFAPNDITKMREAEYQTVRDNVLFELGLFIGRLGRERSFIILPRSIENFHLPTDLLGLTPGTYEPNRQDGRLAAALGPACQQIREAAAKVQARTATEVAQQPSDIFDDNDCLSLIESWMGGRPAQLNTLAIQFSDVDRELRLPPGSAEKFIEIAAKKWGYIPSRRGRQTILFSEARRY